MRGVKGTLSKVTLTCKNCSKAFTIETARFKTGRGKFCSVSCKVAFATITKICETCGKPFQFKRWQSKRRFCSQSCAKKGKPFTEEHSHKISEALMGQRHSWTTEYNLKYKKYPIGEENPNFGKPLLEETKKKLSQARYAYLARVPYEERRRTEESCKNMSEIRKRDWQNPEYVKKVFEGLNRRPTGPEQQLIEIFSKHFPQFEYNGDFSLGVTLSGMIPDFINTNGRKEVIEVFGNYFHSPEVLGNRWQGSELGKMMAYNSLGWRCLVIWEHELKDEASVIAKIKAFAGGRK